MMTNNEISEIIYKATGENNVFVRAACMFPTLALVLKALGGNFGYHDKSLKYQGFYFCDWILWVDYREATIFDQSKDTIERIVGIIKKTD